ncbi:mitochondrial inner membrane protease ATP23 homolog [Chelonus insularis]|uniref:mitochondrial inner membrane protease ATP23 homolog n=1 Tax=Chelonus insularis TaxID=460826 RepID=UPI00158F4C17|nr:mitochondrial inner membrane protease ATP23 homolog [Chelonus insularis]XP_034952472.1 mitochondrial inner membrane protease ATP23 homolog [Chelonus insularis]
MSDNKDNNKPSEEIFKPPVKKTIPDDSGAIYGLDLYPDRRKNKQTTFSKTILMQEGKEDLKKFNCEKKLYDCIKTHPLVKLMMGALKSSGCSMDLRRHFSCEECDPSVTGGYDPEMNQIVICQNSSKSKGMIASVLVHEMIHMFDYCKNNLDFKNIDHVACTEIRAANFTYCSFLSGWFEGDASLRDFRKKHRECVKRRAAISVLASRKTTEEEALAAVERVFDKCYNDMEPIGRRIKRREDMDVALAEASFYGYDT